MIPRGTLVHAFLRTFLLQAGWNYERMQHLGFAYAMLPGLRRVHPGPALGEAVRRHLDYFNTNPYMAPALIGAATALERQVAAGERRPDEVTSFKNGIMGSYGAIGDSLFWAALKPLGAVLAVALILAGAGAVGPVVFVLGFDAATLAIRTYGFFTGASIGPAVVAKLARYDFARANRRLRLTAAALAGIVAALWADWFARSGPALPLPEGWPEAAVVFPAAVVLAGTARRGVSPAGAAGALAAAMAAAGAWKGWG